MGVQTKAVPTPSPVMSQPTCHAHHGPCSDHHAVAGLTPKKVIKSCMKSDKPRSASRGRSSSRARVNPGCIAVDSGGEDEDLCVVTPSRPTVVDMTVDDSISRPVTISPNGISSTPRPGRKNGPRKWRWQRQRQRPWRALPLPLPRRGKAVPRSHAQRPQWTRPRTEWQGWYEEGTPSEHCVHLRQKPELLPVHRQAMVHLLCNRASHLAEL